MIAVRLNIAATINAVRPSGDALVGAEQIDQQAEHADQYGDARAQQHERQKHGHEHFDGAGFFLRHGGR
jgi:hypothetical protein